VCGMVCRNLSEKAGVFLCVSVLMQGTIAGNWSPYDKQNDRRGIAGVVGPAYGNIVRLVLTWMSELCMRSRHNDTCVSQGRVCDEKEASFAFTRGNVGSSADVWYLCTWCAVKPYASSSNCFVSLR
jgi:hypothetical protein